MRNIVIVGLILSLMVVLSCTQQPPAPAVPSGGAPESPMSEDMGDDMATPPSTDGARGSEVTPGPGCTDTDGGKNYNLKGTVTPAGGSAQEDRCVGTQYSYPNRLKEFYCGPDGKHTNELYDCPNSCQDGACA